jgi:hypothetical protein
MTANRLSLLERQWQRRRIVSAEPVRIDSGGYVSQILTDDAEPGDPDPRPAAEQRARRQWLALGLAAGALLIVGALLAGVLYAVSIDRAVNGNLGHISGQLPDETPTADEMARPGNASGEAINYVLMGSDSRDVGTLVTVAVRS